MCTAGFFRLGSIRLIETLYLLIGLPENITEAVIQEIFERCGEITTLRLSKKNFCHIRFVLEASVDAAIYLSGYRVRLGSSGDAANTGRLHVDFAQVSGLRLVHPNSLQYSAVSNKLVR